MKTLRSIHRIITFFVVIVLLYLGVTGTLIQGVDLSSILGKAPANDANVLAMRESYNGPGDFQVLISRDYVAHTLPADADLNAMVLNVAQGARRGAGGKPLTYVELRMADGRPVGQVKVGAGPRGAELLFDPATGAALGAAPPISRDEFGSPKSARNDFKHLHRMTTFGDWALFINVVVAVALGALVVTGLLIYWNLYKGRARNGRSGLFWKAGGWWRTLHRVTALACAIFLTIVTLSGLWLAVESLGMGVYIASHRTTGPDGRPRFVTAPDPASPLQDAELPRMLGATLGGYRHLKPGGAIKVIRLRYYGGMPQGVVVTGDKVSQLVFNAATGKRVSLTEPGYPKVGFPFGWQAHQTAKAIHSGALFGLPGRLIDFIAGLALIYLSVSGIVIYADLWSRRRKAGLSKPLWT